MSISLYDELYLYNVLNDHNDDYLHCNHSEYNIMTFKKYFQSNNSHIVRIWYLKNIDKLSHYHGRQCKIKILQNGGTIKKHQIFSYRSNNILYKIRISYFIINDDFEGDIAKIILINPDLTGKKACITVKIENNDHTAYIDEVYTHYRCTDQEKNPEQAGGIFLQLVIRYLKKHKNELKINRIELTDNSIKNIKTYINIYNIDLFKSRQLENKIPYYMKFGFFPVHQSAYKKLKQNYRTIDNLLTEEIDFKNILLNNYESLLKRLKNLKYIKHFNISAIFSDYQELIDYTDKNSKQLFLFTIQYIRKNYQIIYCEIYLEIFKSIELEVLTSDETVYYLNL